MNWDGIVSLLFFCIEFILLLNVLYFGRKIKIHRKGAAMIALLAGYQLMEYLMCGLDLRFSIAAYIAFVIISFLPPLGFLFVLDLLGKRFRFDQLVFVPAAALVVYYPFVVDRFIVVKCSVFYAIYNYPLGTIYGMFYYLPLFMTIILLFSSLKTEQPSQKKNIKILLSGYLFVSLFVLAAFILRFSGDLYLINMIESVMCKFAIVLAFSIALVIINLSRETT
jgi:hypothetical protein